MPSSAVRRLVQAMPKAELHLHLDGCLRPETAIELATRQGIDAPSTYTGMFGALVAPSQTANQTELLKAFELPLRLMQTTDALARITDDLVADKAADRVRYVEIKWAPAFHRERGLSLDDVISTVADAAAAAAARHDVVVRLCVVAVRGDDPKTNVEVAHAAVAHRDKGVTGFDLAGFEEADPDPTVHHAAFDVARAGGLGLTVHTGELRDGGAMIRRALELGPHRIAHGPAAADDPSLVAELIERNITLDLCPTSNVQSGAVASFAEHPVVRLLRACVPVTINTDDTTISDITLSEEWLSCIDLLDLALPELWACNLHALRAAFVDEPTRARLLEEFDAWGHAIPELR